MNAFQWTTCSLLAATLLRDLLRRWSVAALPLRLTRILVWTTAIVAIANPLQVTRVANLLGIGRGADIVLYAFALAFAAVTFYFYAQHLRLRRELSAIASHIALREATRGGGAQ